MISYIFKSKIKNIFVAIFSAILVFISLNELRDYIIFEIWDIIAFKFIGLIPYVLIFLYMVTLKFEYKYKQLLFPMAFAILALFAVFSIRNCFNEYSISGLVRGFISLNIRVIMIMGHVFCFVGTISNFKRINFLRWGLLFCIITVFILGTSYYHLFGWIVNEFFSTSYYLSETFRATILLLLFYISLFVLTLTKKGEDIDITPYVEKRKIKKEIKKAKKLARENSEEFSPPLVPEGYWRCMGCGEILPDDKSECECGYKR